MVAAVDAPKLLPVRLQHPQHVPAAVASHSRLFFVEYIYTQCAFFQGAGGETVPGESSLPEHLRMLLQHDREPGIGVIEVMGHRLGGAFGLAAGERLQDGTVLGDGLGGLLG